MKKKKIKSLPGPPGGNSAHLRNSTRGPTERSTRADTGTPTGQRPPAYSSISRARSLTPGTHLSVSCAARSSSSREKRCPCATDAGILAASWCVRRSISVASLASCSTTSLHHQRRRDTEKERERIKRGRESQGGPPPRNPACVAVRASDRGLGASPCGV